MAIAFKDNLTDTNGTALPSHTPDIGPNWADLQGGWKINNVNTAVLSSDAGDGLNLAAYDAGVADGTNLTNLITAPFATPFFGVASNIVDASNYWVTWGAGGGSNIWELYQRVAGTLTQRASYSATIPSNQAYAVLVTTNGDSIDISIDGTPRMSYSVGSRPHKTATKHGIWAYGPTEGPDGTEFDYIEFNPLAASGGAGPIFRGRAFGRGRIFGGSAFAA